MSTIQRRRTHPTHEAFASVVVFVAPVVVGLASSAALIGFLERPTTAVLTVAWWIGIVVTCVAVVHWADRLVRLMAPLATLLRLTLVLPDQAPSSYRAARRPRRMDDLHERIERSKRGSLNGAGDLTFETIRALVAALSSHDNRTRGHSERTAVFADMIAREMKISARERERLQWAALLHDVGKLTVHPETLNETGRPEQADWLELLHHPEQGSELAAPVMPWLGEWGRAIAEHHERFDGSGYPRGLSGTEISLGGRIVAVADAYETMTAGRPYRRALSPQEAREEIAKGAGTAYDPKVCRALMSVSLGRTHRARGVIALLGRTPLSKSIDRLGRSKSRSASGTEPMWPARSEAQASNVASIVRLIDRTADETNFKLSYTSLQDDDGHHPTFLEGSGT
jgi:HD-GYP domain-containing protein (c-di-GMP phosphodiesterase class II)